MADYVRTPNYQLYKPTPGVDDDQWGDHQNWNFDTIDSSLKSQSDGLAGGPWLPIVGGTLTGMLTLSGNATLPMHAVPLQQLNAATAGAPFLPLSGGTVTGPTSFDAGLAFSGGSLASGCLASDPNWGAWLQGHSGAISDLVLINSNSTGAYQLGGNGVSTINGGLMLGASPSTARTFNWSGTALLPPNLGFMVAETFAGTMPTGTSQAHGQFPLNWFSITDNLNVGTNTAGMVADFSVSTIMGTPASGNRVGMNVYFNIPVTTADGASHVNANYNAQASSIVMTANAGGTAQTSAGAAGSIFGDVKFVQLGGAASYNHDIVGLELDVISAVAQPVAPLRKVGIQIIGYDDGTTTDLSHGASIDAALLVAGNGASPGFYDGIQFGAGNGVNGLGVSATGRLISTYTATPTLYTAQNALYLLETNFTGYVAQWKQTGLGQGLIDLGAGRLSSTAAGISLDTSGSIGPAEGAALSPAAGGTGWTTGSIVHDAYGGLYSVTTQTAGVVQANGLTVLRQPMVNGAAPANPVTLTPRRGSPGTGLTANLTWTAGTTIALGAAGATTLNIGTGLTTLTNPTSNFVDFGTAGSAYPTFTTRSAGSKVVLFDALSGSTTDFAIGIGPNRLWFGVSNPATDYFVWFAGTSIAGYLSGQGSLLLNGGFGVFAAGPITTKPTVTGAKGGNAALASLLSALASYGLVLDSST